MQDEPDDGDSSTCDDAEACCDDQDGEHDGDELVRCNEMAPAMGLEPTASQVRGSSMPQTQLRCVQGFMTELAHG